MLPWMKFTEPLGLNSTDERDRRLRSSIWTPRTIRRGSGSAEFRRAAAALAADGCKRKIRTLQMRTHGTANCGSRSGSQANNQYGYTAHGWGCPRTSPEMIHRFIAKLPESAKPDTLPRVQLSGSHRKMSRRKRSGPVTLDPMMLVRVKRPRSLVHER